jgi:type IV fimbrial biogenesis protein FimT
MRVRGFTLVELMVVITIATILFSMGVPSYRYVTNANRMSAEVNALLGDMQYARAEAIKEGQTVTVCASADGATCSNSITWEKGWMVFSDPLGNATWQTGDPILRVQQGFSASDTFRADNNVAAVTFNREGFAVNIINGGTIALHDATANPGWTRCLAISMVGQMTTETRGAGNCQ